MTAPFYNRARELASLRAAIGSEKSEILIIYGRRGVGKSSLLERALAQSGLPYVFYRATRRTLPIQLAALTRDVKEAYPNAFLPQPFESFSVFLDFLSHQATESEAAGGPPIVAVIDELPYLAECDSGVLTVLQHWWDRNKRRPNIKLFVAGSYVAFMERQVLDINAPLYNRRTGAMKLEPMDYREAGLFFPEYDSQEKMAAYAILGGLPSYLEQFDPADTIANNVKATVLRRNTYLSEEPDWLLLEDLRRDSVYGSILRAIAHGERKPTDIARAIGKNSAQDVAPALETLRGLGLVLRELPITDILKSRPRTSLYWIADAYLDFWYRFVDPSRSLIARGLGDRLWEQSIEPALQHHISKPTFERASRQYLWRALADGSLPDGMSFSEVGMWWGMGNREIDVVAVDERQRPTVIGSCKWTARAVDVVDYAALIADSRAACEALQIDPDAVGRQDGPWLMLFSKSGFTDRLTEIAQQSPSRLHLISVAAMYASSGTG